MKITVASICKNEVKHVERWLKAVAPADYIVVLDTGSTDGTVDAICNQRIEAKAQLLTLDLSEDWLKESFKENIKEYPQPSGLMVLVKGNVTPWRFDDARNRAMPFIPRCDAVFWLDLDEVPCTDWRQKLENDWQNGVTRLQYTYHQSHHPDGKPRQTIVRDLIHAPAGYSWQYPVHEVLIAKNQSAEKVGKSSIVVDHWPDTSKSRSDYLPLLQMAVNEYKNDPRCLSQLAQEYIRRRELNLARPVLLDALLYQTWRPGRAQICIALGRIALLSPRTIGNPLKKAIRWFQQAAETFPEQREAWVVLAEAHMDNGDPEAALLAVRQAKAITKRAPLSTVEDRCWDASVVDKIEADCLYWLGR